MGGSSHAKLDSLAPVFVHHYVCVSACVLCDEMNISKGRLDLSESHPPLPFVCLDLDTSHFAHVHVEQIHTRRYNYSMLVSFLVQ